MAGTKKQAPPLKQHAMKTRRGGPVSPDISETASKPASAPAPVPVATLRRGRSASQDPQPALSSRSQTPHIDTESDSLPPIPESRSTTPPVERPSGRARLPGRKEQERSMGHSSTDEDGAPLEQESMNKQAEKGIRAERKEKKRATAAALVAGSDPTFGHSSGDDGKKAASNSLPQIPSTESKQLPKVSEARPTIATTRRSTRSQTRSVSPDTAIQQHKAPVIPYFAAERKRQPKLTEKKPQSDTGTGKPDHVRQSIARNIRRHTSGNASGNTGRNNKKRSRTETTETDSNTIANPNTLDEERPIKRSRRNEQEANDDSMPAFKESLPTIIEDSGADDDIAEAEHPSRSIKRVTPKPLSSTKKSNGHDPVPSELEENAFLAPPPTSSAERSNARNTLSYFGEARRRLTPKPTSSAKKSIPRDPMSDDIEERNRLHIEMTGRNMPIDRYQKGHPKYAHSHHRDNTNNGEEDDDETSFVVDDSPTRTRLPGLKQALSIVKPSFHSWAIESRLAIQKNREAREAAQARKKEHDAKASREKSKSFNCSFPATSTRPALKFMNNRYVGGFRELCDFLVENPDHPPFKAGEMRQLMTAHIALQSASQHRYLAPHEIELDQSNRQLQRESVPHNASKRRSKSPHDTEPKRSGPQLQLEPTESIAKKSPTAIVRHHDDVEAREEQSEVQTTASPQTLEPQPDAQQSRRWYTGGLTGVASFLTSPLKVLGRRNQSTETATTNGAAVSGTTPSNEHLMPQTSDFAIPPRSADFANSGRRSNINRARPRRRTPIATPSKSRNHRPAVPQTEPRPLASALAQYPKTVAQTSRRVHWVDGIRIPSPTTPRQEENKRRRLAMWAEWDAAAAETNRAEDMENHRAAERALRQARVEDEDEHNANQNAEAARVGDKRKTRHSAVPAVPDVQDLPAHVRDLPARSGLTHEEFNWEGTFTAPGSDEEDDSQIDLEMNNGSLSFQGYGIIAHAFPGNNTPASHENGHRSSRPTISYRKNHYDGTIFTIPPEMQRNIDEGKRPTAPRPKITDTDAEETAVIPREGETTTQRFNVFARAQRTRDIMFPKEAAARRAREGITSLSNASESSQVLTAEQPAQPIMEERQETPLAEAGPAVSTVGSSFSAPNYGDEADENVVNGGNGTGKENEAHDASESVADETSVLQPKTWAQTPPPKPKPSYRQLPLPNAAEPSDVARTWATFEKHRPSVPSNLRHVTQMSPLHPDQLTAEDPRGTSSFAMIKNSAGAIQNQSAPPPGVTYPLGDDFAGYGFDPAVVEALLAIPDKDMRETKIPDWVFEEVEEIGVSDAIQRHVAQLFGDE